ncbi:unnamed protein product [Calicophoron daubneyi]|uniref:Uncharacterized protein n=1 Tax=Calicophoron daubneyi TaxID=300641 RepID=A0AAV2TEX4_CALDB
MLWTLLFYLQACTIQQLKASSTGDEIFPGTQGLNALELGGENGRESQEQKLWVTNRSGHKVPAEMSNSDDAVELVRVARKVDPFTADQVKVTVEPGLSYFSMAGLGLGTTLMVLLVIFKLVSNEELKYKLEHGEPAPGRCCASLPYAKPGLSWDP